MSDCAFLLTRILSGRGGVGARTEWQGSDRNGHLGRLYFQKLQPPHCASVQRLDPGPIHGRSQDVDLQGQDRCYTPRRRVSLFGCEGDRHDKLISFKTKAYVQANTLLCATYMTPKEDLFERARAFQDSVEACYKTIIPQSTGPHLPAPPPPTFRLLSGVAGGTVPVLK